MIIRKILCKIGWHIPKNETLVYIDRIDHCDVYEGKCACGITWIHSWSMKIKKE